MFGMSLQGKKVVKGKVVRKLVGAKAGGGFVSEAGSRVVILEGTANFNQLVGNPQGLEPTIRTLLSSAGFDVINVSVLKVTLFTSQLSLRLELNVSNNFTSEDARVSAIRQLASLKRTFGFEFFVLTNVQLSVTADYYKTTPPTTPKEQQQKQPQINGGGLSETITDVLDTKGAGGFLDNLGAGIGLSSPIVIGGLIIAGIIILKK